MDFLQKLWDYKEYFSRAFKIVDLVGNDPSFYMSSSSATTEAIELLQLFFLRILFYGYLDFYRILLGIQWETNYENQLPPNTSGSNQISNDCSFSRHLNCIGHNSTTLVLCFQIQRVLSILFRFGNNFLGASPGAAL